MKNVIGPRILVLSPHPDDAELGCGGTVARILEENMEVFYVIFSTAEKSLPKGVPKNILIKEAKNALKTLGINKNNIFILNFEVRNFPKFRQDILEKLVEYKKEIKPETLLVPSLKDLHQDHNVIAIEALRAFKESASTILGYEEPWNYITFDNVFFISLEDRHIETKIKALKNYKSQSHRSYLNEDFIRGLARVRGLQIGTKYAEAFEVCKVVIR